jgi:hypothetical protein
VPPRESEAACGYVPYVPARDEFPAEVADAMSARFASVWAKEGARGARFARQAVTEFTGPEHEGNVPRQDLVITPAFLIAWLVCAAMDAPAWRWVGLSHGNAALTVGYAPGRPASVLASRPGLGSRCLSGCER